jgi:hypothetical protein
MIEAAARQARELRELAQRCIAWHAEGFPISDPHDTYPDDLWAAAARPEAIIAVLDEIDAALSQQAAPAEPLNLNDKAVQKRLAAQWGFAPAPLPEAQAPDGWKQP